MSMIFINIFITYKEIKKTWTIVRFENKNVAVPTIWIVNNSYRPLCIIQ